MASSAAQSGTCSARATWSTAATTSRSTCRRWPVEAHVSPRHFSRSFRQVFGETPYQYLLTRRLERARHLLRTTEMTRRGDLPGSRVHQRRLVHDDLHDGTSASRRPPFARPTAVPSERRPDPALLRDGLGAAGRLARFEKTASSSGWLGSSVVKSDPRKGTKTMIDAISHVGVWVDDQDEAKAFYTEKLGFEVRQDATLEEFGRLPLAHSRTPPTSPTSTSSSARRSRRRSTPRAPSRSWLWCASGAMGPGIFRTADCRKTAEELKERGVEFTAGARRAVLRRRRRRFRDPSGNEWRLVQPIEYDLETVQGAGANGG